MESDLSKEGTSGQAALGDTFRKRLALGLWCVLWILSPIWRVERPQSQHRFQLARAPVKLMGYGFQCSEPQVPDVGIWI